MFGRIVGSLTLLAAIAIASPASAAITTICSDIQPILDYPDCHCGKPLPPVQPVALFSFEGQPKLTNITGMKFLMTMQNGATGLGDVNYNNLNLVLDSVDTGLKLNGFTAGDENVTLEFVWDATDANWPSQDKLNQILADLYDDNMLLAAIKNLNTNDTNPVNLYSQFDTKLCITGETGDPSVPEPASLLVWALALGVPSGRRAMARWRKTG